MVRFLLFYFVGVGLISFIGVIYTCYYAEAKRHISDKELKEIVKKEAGLFGLYSIFGKLHPVLKLVVNVILIILMPLELIRTSYIVIRESDRIYFERKGRPE